MTRELTELEKRARDLLTVGPGNRGAMTQLEAARELDLSPHRMYVTVAHLRDLGVELPLDDEELTDRDREVRELIEAGEKQVDIAHRLGINKQRVSQIVLRLRAVRGVKIPEPKRGRRARL